MFPDLETLPYDGFSAHPDITSARLSALAALPRATSGVWVVAVDTLLQRLPPRSYIEGHSLKVHVGEALDIEALRAQLTAAGYAAVTQVVAHGEFAVRGSLLDVFPMGSDCPFRIDMLDRDVDSIRRFDPDSQRSGEKLARIELLPARETPLSPDAVREFRRRYRIRFAGDLSEHAIYRDVSQGGQRQGATRDAQIEVVCDALLEVAVQMHAVNPTQGIPQAVALRAYAWDFGSHFFLRNTKTFAHAGDLVRGERAGTQAAFMTTAMHLALDAHL